jgi:transposase
MDTGSRKTKRDGWPPLEQIGADGVQLLVSLAKEPEVEYLARLPALQTLLATWAQQYDLQASPLHWRSQGELPPSADRLASPYDPQARYSTKGGDITWVGYKVHLTETCEDDTLHLITQVETTPATEADNVALPRIHQELDERALSTWGTPGGHHLWRRRNYCSPARRRMEWSCSVPCASISNGKRKLVPESDMSAFLVDWEAQQVICPQGNVSRSWKPERRPNGKPTIQVQFSRAQCRACPARSQCTRNQSGPRQLILNPKAEHQAIQAARERQKTQAFKRQYARAGGDRGHALAKRLCASHAAFAVSRAGEDPSPACLDRLSDQPASCLRLAGRDPKDQDTEVAFCRTDGCLMISPTASIEGIIRQASIWRR